jgi:ParB family chromosome partitioning protein
MAKKMPHIKPISTYIPLHQLTRGQFQPRQHFGQEQLQELAASIRTTQGVLQPLIVRRQDADCYEIIAGERRWRAAQLAGLTEIHCLVVHYTDEQAIEAAIIENISRADLNPIEEANAYQRMIDSFEYSHEEIGAAVGKSRSKITNALRLLKLDKYVQGMLIEQRLSEGHGKVLAGLGHLQQYALAQKCLIHDWSVRQLEKAVRQDTPDSLNDFPKHTAIIDPNIQVLENALSEYLGCPTHIEFSRNKKRLSIDFHNLDVLEGLLAKIGFKS